MTEIDEGKRSAKTRENRLIGHFKAGEEGPTLVFFGGIHGNEPAGIQALEAVLQDLQNGNHRYMGEVYAIAGNLAALQENQRFNEEDLNRIWLPQRIDQMRGNVLPTTADALEMQQLYHLIQTILETAAPPFYFFDLHTTSGKTSPFIVVNDSLLNRRFTRHYPLPIILGIEEYLTGALLSYINELGYVSFGFEAGQHYDPISVKVAKDFIWYSMALAGFLETSVQELAATKRNLAKYTLKDARFFEIYHQYDIQEGEDFQMAPGFDNFQVIPKGTLLAQTNGKPIITKKKRRIFMPLYQKKGREGFYFIKKTPKVFLVLSSYLRKLRVDEVLVCLPGVQWASLKKEGLMVDQRVARYFAKSIFHLLGYRARQKDEAHLIVHGREKASKTKQYVKSLWY